MSTLPAPVKRSPPPRPGRSLAALALSSIALLAWAPPAAGLAPDHTWRTLESPHFVVHFHEGLHPMANRAAASLERAHERLVPLLGSEPQRKTQVVLSDDTDSANGSASAFERPRIWLLAEPPDARSDLGDYDDYVFLLVAHEYVHVLHLGTASGAWSILGFLFGDLFLPNGMHPRFFTEGLATYHESQISRGGRIRSALFDMYLRTDVLEGRVLTLSRLSGGTLRWPRGTAAYLYGGRMLAWLAETRGDEAIRAYVQGYGASLPPYAMDASLKAEAGIDFEALWDEWVESLRDRYAAQEAHVRARGEITAPAFTTAHGERTGSPRWSRDGEALLYVEATAHRRPRLRAADPRAGADREIAELGSAGGIAPLPGGRTLVARQEVLGFHRVVGDLFVVDRSGEAPITEGLRAWEPDVSPDGRHVYFVKRNLGRTTLERISLEDPRAPAVRIYAPPEGREIASPRVSPDGGRVVISQTRGGPGRDIVVIPAGGGAPLHVTDDDASDLDPAWTPDGGAIVFSSDRTGIFNLFAARAEGGDLLRLTNVLTGAFEPDLSPDGTWIAWTTYGPNGFDVAATPMERLRPVPAEVFTSDRASIGHVAAEAPEPIYPVRRYSPLETLGPQSWFPYLGADRGGTVLGASVSGADAVGLHAWTLSAGAGIESRQPEGAASWTYGGWRAQPTLSGATAFRGTPGFVLGTTERVTVGSAGLALPFASTRHSQTMSLAYQATWFQPVHVVDGAPQPAPGVATELQLRWQYGNAERPPESISPENGIGLGVLGRAGSRALGGDYDYTSASGSASAWLRMPWARHHVLAATLAGGIGHGDQGERRLFGLGGPRLGNPLLDLLFTGQLIGGGQLRGYAPGAFVGSAFALGSLEYRFPIAWIDRSPSVLPLYAGKLSGAVFADAGDAFEPGRPVTPHPSVGAELRLGVELGWAIAGSIVVGDAYGFDVGAGGGHRPYLGAGASF